LKAGERYLLIGPVSRDRIVRGERVSLRTGGAVYYYARLLSYLGVEHTAVVTIAEEDLHLFEAFPEDTEIIPVYREATVEFENIYSDGDPDDRIQRSNFAENPLYVDDIVEMAGEGWTAVLAGPLLPSDIPISTLKFLGEGHSLYTGLQGYLRFQGNPGVSLGFSRKIWSVLDCSDAVFLDVNELGVIADERRRALMLMGEHVDEAVVTRGSRGSFIYRRGRLMEVKAVEAVRELEPTGLGDTYMAAYVYMRQRAGPLDAGRFASMMATRKLEGKI